MRLIFTMLVMFLVLSLAISATAGEGRYQALRVADGVIIILDTKGGHLWQWIAADEIKYQGRVIPGGKIPADLVPLRTLPDIRKLYHAYDDISDQEFADALYKSYFFWMDRQEFNRRIGLE